MNIVKRDGSTQEFKFEKIEKAVKAAFGSDGGAEKVLQVIRDSIEEQSEISVETVQDTVEKCLMFCGYYDVAKRYILYRAKHNAIRETVNRHIDFITKYKKSDNTADATVDDNSNVRGKNVGIINAEIKKSENILVNRGMVMNKLKEIFPDFDYKQYVKDLERHIIYKHDESSSNSGATMPYCCSISMYPFIQKGIKELGGLSASPKNLDSFCGMFCNLIFCVSGMFLGAVATSEFLLYFTYFCKKEWGNEFWKYPDTKISINSLREKTIRSQIHQYWQQVIYTINQSAANRGMQSAFVNFSIFDKPFFEGMFGNFFFPDHTQPDWESLCWIQKEFMQWFNAERLRTMLTFPVESCTLLYKDGKFIDEDMYNFVCEEYARGHSFFTYISSSVDSLSSCCFDKDTRIMYSIDNKSFVKCEEIESVYNTYKDKTINAFVNNPYTGFREWKQSKLVKAETYQWIEFNRYTDEIKWRKFKVTPDHILPIKRNDIIIDIPASQIQIGDYLIYDKAQREISLEDYSELEYVEIKTINVVPLSMPDSCYCIEVLDDNNPYFVLSNGLITHNCRLKNKIQTREFNFTNGNMGVETGSKSVITLNFSRIIQDWFKTIDHYEDHLDVSGKVSAPFDFIWNNKSKSSLKKYMYDILERVYKYHVAYNELLWDMYNNDLLPAYSAGFINLDKQYLTIGGNGLNQSAEFLGIDCRDNLQYQDFVEFLFSSIKEFNQAHSGKFNNHQITLNFEQVPAESLAIKNYNWDKEENYWVPSDTNLYASYVFKPNDPRLSVLEKMRLHGARYLGDFVDGGASAHINLDAHLSVEQYKKLVKYAAEVGCEYFTFNIPNCECDDCGYIAKQPFKKCPKCGSERVSLWDRVIGYLTKIKNWSSGRQIEQKTRVYTTPDKITEITAK